MSEVWMAFSMALRVDLSHGAMRMVRASGTDTAAIWLTGVGTP